MARPTHLIVIDGVIQDTELGFAWSDALDLIWSGGYNAGALQVIRLDDTAGTSSHVTTAMLVDLAARTYELRETPDHLVPLFEAARLSDGRRLSFYRPALSRHLIACDRAAYERRHGTLDGGPAWRSEDTASARAEMMAEAF